MICVLLGGLGAVGSRIGGPCEQSGERREGEGTGAARLGKVR